MKYEIEKGDLFLCTKKFVMDDKEVAYKKNGIYKSDQKHCITDEQRFETHNMENLDDFFDHFKPITKTSNNQ